MIRNIENFLLRLDKAKTLSKGLTQKILSYPYRERIEVNDAPQVSLSSLDYLEQLLLQYQINYRLSLADLELIPDQGRVVIVANKAFGVVDSLILIDLVHRIRKDVMLLVSDYNELLSDIPPLKDALLMNKADDDAFSASQRKGRDHELIDHLQHEGALIVFPSSNKTRTLASPVKTSAWSSLFLRVARRTQSPIVPVYIGTRKHLTRTLASSLVTEDDQALATLMKQLSLYQGKKISVVIGRQVPVASLKGFSAKRGVKSFKKHLFLVGKGKRGVLSTETPIAPKEERQELLQELQQCEVLGETPDQKVIYLYQRRDTQHSSLLREIGRLREIAFRAVGEGTGRRRDLDQYDDDYYQLVLWDPNLLEVIGAYRFVPAIKQLEKHGVQGLYTASLFNLSPEVIEKLPYAVELGRSFIQPRYWGLRGLDYLWFGIGAFLKRYPQYKYLFGPVSLSAHFPLQAKALIIDFYKRYFFDSTVGVSAKNPYELSGSVFNGSNYKEEFRTLKNQLDNLGCAVPTLYKQYTELCEPGGASFYAFGVDPDFGNCIDGLVWVDLAYLKANKRQRYLGEKKVSPSSEVVASI